MLPRFAQSAAAIELSIILGPVISALDASSLYCVIVKNFGVVNYMNQIALNLSQFLMMHALVSDETWYAFICIPLFALLILPLYRYIRDVWTTNIFPGILTVAWIIGAALTILLVLIPIIVKEIIRWFTAGV